MEREFCCVICRDDEVCLTRVQGDWWCDACIAWERTADIEGYEERRRQRLAEQAEY